MKEKIIRKRPKSLTEKTFTYCSGCHHGIIHRLLAEIMDELELQEKTIAVIGVGCSVFGPEFFNTDGINVAHGRAPAVAAGIKRTEPDKIVFTYQGDGDAAAIGLLETIHAANRGENITVIFVNNAIYGMTGGQMAPTTLPGQKTTTTPEGRNPENKEGEPLPMCELLNVLKKPVYIARVCVTSPKRVIEAKQALRRAFESQIKNKGFSFVEVLSACPTNWKMTPEQCLKYIDAEMTKYFPLKVFREPELEEGECRCRCKQKKE